MATVPPAAASAGTVDVTVTTRAGTTATSAADEFSYATQIADPSSARTSSRQVVGVAVGTPPSVVVNDALDQPVQGVSVTFAVTSGGGSVTGTTAVTNTSGVATVGSWTLGSDRGAPTRLRRRCAQARRRDLQRHRRGRRAAFSITANGRTEPGRRRRGGCAPRPSVSSNDSDGNRVPDATITFTVALGRRLGRGGGAAVDVVTDASGVATVGSWTLGSRLGTNTLTASRPGVAARR